MTSPTAAQTSVPLTTRRAAWWSVAWLALGLAAGMVVLALADSDRAVKYWAV